jgi:large subunit ribosomal protein L15
MLLHEARTADLGHKKRIRVGRGPGSGLGKTSGRGIKGATSRSGWTMKVTYEGGQMPLFRRLPKRGFTNGPFRVTFSVVNVGDLSEFKAGSTVGPEELRKAGVIQGPKSWPVKVLGDGEIKVALTVKADGFSKSAIEKIVKAGGKIEWIGGAQKKPSPNFKKLEAEKKAKAADKAKSEKKGDEGKGGKGPKAEGGKPEGGKAPKPEGGKPPKAEGEKPAKPEGAKPPKAEGGKPPKQPKAESAKPAPEGEKKPPQQ